MKRLARSWIGKDATYEFNKSTDAFAGATYHLKLFIQEL